MRIAAVPGERFRYNTGATVAGILIERATGAPLAEVLSKRVFEPLGMTDTALYVPASKMSRFTSMYAPAEAATVFGGSADDAGSGGLVLIDRPDGWYAAPPVLPDGAAASSPRSTTWGPSPPCWQPTAGACWRKTRSH